MDIIEMAELVKDKEGFVKFLQALWDNLEFHREHWENPELGRYIEAMKRFLDDTKEDSLNKMDFTPSWNLFAKIMIAASIYE